MKLHKVFKALNVLMFCQTFVFSVFSEAAPFPGTGSSALVSPQSGLFFAARGFQIKAQEQWQIETPKTAKEENTTEFSVHYSNPTFTTAKLSVQTDTLKSETTLEAYTKKWMKDYSSYGFDVLGAKTFQTTNAKGLVVDIHHRKKETQLRQIIFLKDKTAVIVTCLDQTKNFAKSLPGCNQLARSFQWL